MIAGKLPRAWTTIRAGVLGVAVLAGCERSSDDGKPPPPPPAKVRVVTPQPVAVLAAPASVVAVLAATAAPIPAGWIRETRKVRFLGAKEAPERERARRLPVPVQVLEPRLRVS